MKRIKKIFLGLKQFVKQIVRPNILFRKMFLGLKQFVKQIVRPNILFRKMFLGALVLVVMAVLGVVYVFFTAKNKIATLKIGENVFEIELAETVGQQAKGLSYRDNLPENKGMLFDFGKGALSGFWMMGMKFPIDIIWIKNNEVIGIEKNVPALTSGEPENALKLYYPPQTIDRVLEINAGLSDKLGIKIGDKIAF